MPTVHSMEMAAVGLYPLLHAGVHTDPEGVVAPQAEKVSLALSGSCAQGLGPHTPAGVLNTPAVQVICSEPVAV